MPITISDIRNARKLLGNQGCDHKNLRLSANNDDLLEIFRLPEFLGIHKYAPNTKLIQGEIGRIDGIIIRLGICSDTILYSLSGDHINVSDIIRKREYVAPTYSPAHLELAEFLNVKPENLLEVL